LRGEMARWGLPHLARINTDEYVSRSGCHEVRVSFKPLFTTRRHDYYAYFPLFRASTRARRRAEDIVDEAYRMYIAQLIEERRHPPKLGYIVFKVASGWHTALLVYPVDADVFFDALQRFSKKIYPMLLLVY